MDTYNIHSEKATPKNYQYTTCNVKNGINIG